MGDAALTADRRTPVDRSAPCRIWSGSCNDDGYGHLVIDGQRKYAHRVSYQLHVGPIRRDHQIDHLCRVPACYEPAHLEAVTNREKHDARQPSARGQESADALQAEPRPARLSERLRSP
jgi:hypothetical protein